MKKVLVLILLVSNLFAAEDVLVLGLKSNLSLNDSSVGTIVISQKEIEQFKGCSVRDVLDSAVGVTEVASQSELGSNSTIRLRGNGSDYTLVLIDGQPINSSALGGAGVEMIDLDQVERIEIIKGANSSILGSGAVGGAVNFIMKKGQKYHQIKTDFGSYGYQKYSANLNFTDLGINYSDTSYLGWRENSQYYSKNFMTNFKKELSFDSDLIFRYIYNEAEVGVPGQLTDANWLGLLPKDYDGKIEKTATTPNDKNKFAKHYFQTTYKKLFDEKELTVRLFNNYDEKKDIDTDFNTNDYFRELKYGFETKLKLETLVFGYQIEYDEAKKNSEYDFTRTINSLYTEKTFKLSNFTNTLALRYDDAGQYGNGYSPRVGSVYRFNDNLKFSANLARSFRVVEFTELPKNEKSKYEDGLNGDLGCEINVDQLTFGTVYFQQKMNNRITWVFENGDYVTKQNKEAVSEGFESFVKFKQTKLLHEINYLYTDARIKENKDSKFIRDTYVPYNKLSYILNASFTDELSALLKFQSIGEQKVYGQSMKAYTTTDLTLNYRIAYVGVENIFDEKFQFRDGYPIPGRTYKAGLKFQF